MKRLAAPGTWVLVLLILCGASPALAGDPVQDLAAAKRLACAFVKGITAVFSPQGGVLLKPPLDPNSPGLTINLVDRAKGQAVLEEDDRETPGTLAAVPSGLSILARDQSGSETLVTVFAQYSGVSDNFFMVSSRHGGGTQPQLSQRYGLCRVVRPEPTTPVANPAPTPHHP
jgi:hypothetical protein